MLSTASPPLMPPAPLELVLASPPRDLPVLPALPESLPPAATLSARAALADPPPPMPPMDLPAPPSLPESLPPVVALAERAAPVHQPPPMPMPSDTGSTVPAASTIPAAPPSRMSLYYPSASFKIICCYCFRNSHNISYQQCPGCYKTGGGTNYTRK
jgi:hypothetical protein